MARRHFILPNVAANARVRIDTASGTTSPADIVNDSGLAVAGAILHADGSGFLGDEIYGPVDGTKTLYVKTLNDSDAVTATATLTARHSGQVTAAQGADNLSVRAQTPTACPDGGAVFLHFDQVQEPGNGLLTLDTDGLGVTVTADAYVIATTTVEVTLTPGNGVVATAYAEIGNNTSSDINTWNATWGEDCSQPFTGDGSAQYVAIPITVARKMSAGSKIRVDVAFTDGTDSSHDVQANLDIVAFAAA